MKWDDLHDLPWPLALFFGTNYVLATIRDAIVFLLILGVAVTCLVVGSTLGRYVGAVLLLAWLLVAFRLGRRHLARWHATDRAAPGGR